MFCFAGRFDPYKFTSEQMARAHGLVCEALMDDQLNQVYGYTYINDESGLLMGHVSLWSLTDIKAIMGCIQVRLPLNCSPTHSLQNNNTIIITGPDPMVGFGLRGGPSSQVFPFKRRFQIASAKPRST